MKFILREGGCKLKKFRNLCTMVTELPQSSQDRNVNSSTNQVSDMVCSFKNTLEKIK
jgi:hypothetical protein